MDEPRIVCDPNILCGKPTIAGTRISVELILAKARVTARGLRRNFGIENPRLAFAGLNPHAGEGGLFGRQDIDVSAPTIARAVADGMRVSGPVPGDTVFVKLRAGQYDAVVAMYHDQGLPVLKHAGFGEAVNLTLGLQILRTSVDHGTALELAGSGRAEAGSLRAALRLALQLAAPA